MQQQVLVNIPRTPATSYPIIIGEDLLHKWPEWLSSNAETKKVVIITDDTVVNLIARQFTDRLKAAGYEVVLLTFKSGEEAKNFVTFEYLLEQMLVNKCDRYTLCLAIGGGVVGDVTGFVAACFMRGIKYIQIPTTLLSMIDSSVGGKTAINSKMGKNLIGAFYQPCAVITDVNLLNSLPKEQLINGLIEAIKIFLTSDREYFEYVCANLEKILAYDATTLIKVIKRAVQLKAMVVEQDEKEQNLRMILNFGHSVGHAIEKVSGYKILHGFAVALGVLVEAKIAVLLGYLSEAKYLLIENLMNRLDINFNNMAGFATDDIITAIYGDKKNKAGKIKMILLSDIGAVKLTSEGLIANNVAEDIIRQVIAN